MSEGFDLVSINFTVFKEKILSGEKCQTIRVDKEYYRRLMPGVTLHLYWKMRTKECELLWKVKMDHYVPITFAEFTEEIAIADGFNSLAEMYAFFLKTYGKKAETQPYLLIKWEKPLVLKSISEVRQEMSELDPVEWRESHPFIPLPDGSLLDPEIEKVHEGADLPDSPEFAYSRENGKLKVVRKIKRRCYCGGVSIIGDDGARYCDECGKPL